MTGENRTTRRKTGPGAALPNENLTWTGKRLNPAHNFVEAIFKYPVFSVQVFIT
jgi:hypothetical protein